MKVPGPVLIALLLVQATTGSLTVK
jgi:heme A synthase